MTTRRTFMKDGILAASALLASRAPVIAQGSKSTVVVSKGSPGESVRKVLDALGGMGRFVKKGDRVILKPNIGFPNPPELAATTHPDVIRALAELCLEAGAQRVIVLDHPLRDSKLCIERCGIGKALNDLKGSVIAMLDDEKFYEEVPIPQAKELKKTAVMKELKKANCLINIPTAKSHSATGVSLGIKNLMGLVYDRGVFHEKMELNRAIAEQLYIIKPHLTVVSCLYALVTDGPAGPGKVEKLDTVVASTDPVAADSYTVSMTRWYNREFKGNQVKHIKIANELGFGEIDVSKMEIKNV